MGLIVRTFLLFTIPLIRTIFYSVAHFSSLVYPATVTLSDDC